MSNTLAAFTDLNPPADGYVGFTNISAADDGKGVWITVRPTGVPGSCTQAHFVPLADAMSLLGKAFIGTLVIRRAQVEGVSVAEINARDGEDHDVLLAAMLAELEDPNA